METTIKNNDTHIETTQSSTSRWKRFINWSAGQEENRIMWTAITIFGHGCIVTVLTILAIVLTGNNFIYWPFAIVAIAAPVVGNLAAMPTKITIPVFFFSILIDLVIIISCLVSGFSSSTYI